MTNDRFWTWFWVMVFVAAFVAISLGLWDTGDAHGPIGPFGTGG